MLYLVSARNLPVRHEGVTITRLQAYMTDDDNFIKGLSGKNVWVEHARPEQIGVYYSQFAHQIDKLGGIRKMITDLSTVKPDLTKELEDAKKECECLKEELEKLKSKDSNPEENMPCKPKSESKPKAVKKPTTGKGKK